VLRRRDSEYETNVFINCPFDDEYTPLFEAEISKGASTPYEWLIP